jgi:carbon monoxide dehydrogenase subunit G
MIDSNKIVIDKSDEKVFLFISDFNNFTHLMPPEVKDLKVTENECSFSIQGMPTIFLKMEEKTPYSLVKMCSKDGKLNFSLKCILEKIDENSCYAYFNFDAELNSMMKMMVQKPLTNFLNTLVEKLKLIP